MGSRRLINGVDPDEDAVERPMDGGIIGDSLYSSTSSTAIIEERPLLDDEDDDGVPSAEAAGI